jgi:uncharacterized protein YerC
VVQRNNRQVIAHKSPEILALQLELMNSARSLVDLVELESFVAALALANEIQAAAFKLKVLSEIRERQLELAVSERTPQTAALAL